MWVLSFDKLCSHHNVYAPFLWCRYAAVFAAFVAGMTCLVGIEFNAKLVASVDKSFEVKVMDSKLEADHSANVQPSKQLYTLSTILNIVIINKTYLCY